MSHQLLVCDAKEILFHIVNLWLILSSCRSQRSFLLHVPVWMASSVLLIHAIYEINWKLAFIIIIYPVDIDITLQFKGQSRCEVHLFLTTVLAAHMHLLARAVHSHNTRLNEHPHWRRKIFMACSTRAWASLNLTAGARNVSSPDSVQKPLSKWCVSLLIIWGHGHISCSITNRWWYTQPQC